ncbi:MAG: hypothetical protein VX130_00885 [Verrucomicrobiota bacterium]|nr:hypothetical protein [Verrucomicrobiota bacterium]
MKILVRYILFLLLFSFSMYAVPPVLNYAGQVAVNGEAFNGNGLFKFALVNADGNVTYWSNDGTSVDGSEPQASVAVPVNGGLYAVLLGNTAQQGMGAINPAVFAQHTDAKLRLWFSDGINGFQQLSPDRPFASVPYAFSAGTATIADGSINKSMLGSDVIADLNKSSTTASPITLSMLAPEVKAQIDASIHNYGDLKYSFQNMDHSGWIKLDGRSVLTLKDSQILRATALGFVSNIPDARGSVLMQNDQPLGQITGDNNITIAKENLPLVDFNGTTDVSGSHTHKFNFKSKATAGTTYSEINGGTNGGGSWGQYNTTSAGAHDHNVTVSSGGSGIPINITPKSLSANAFIYLGD